STLARQHPDWLLRAKSGRWARAGFVWNSLPYALDLTHPEALHYTREVIRTAVHEWGFPYLKLDFLYAAALEGRYRDPTRTRAQVLHAGMAAIRAEAGEETFLLGCGLPLGSALGWVDAMRISADVGEAWRPRFANLDFPFKNEWRMPSARNAIQNSLTRVHLHRRWWINDPDCLLVRPDSNLTLAEVQTLAAVIGLSGGSLLLSDDLTHLPEERLRIAESLLPVSESPAWVVDWLDETTPRKIRVDLTGPAGRWQVLAWFNPSDTAQPFHFQPEEYHLPPGLYFARSFWDGQTVLTTTGEGVSLGIVPPHGTVVLAVRPRLEGQPQYLGSDLHITQGIELAEWSPRADGLSLTLRLARQASGEVELNLPSKPKTVRAGSRPVDWQALGDNRFQIPVQFEGEIQIEILYAE
ncbi:MAG TPA: hypothetical protein VFF68_09835, partial [Anaerolineaceae bacterium]|nr:hypothetical protein [Anaerolineaceae bacterium]